jgi:hypothetical protein
MRNEHTVCGCKRCKRKLKMKPSTGFARFDADLRDRFGRNFTLGHDFRRKFSLTLSRKE